MDLKHFGFSKQEMVTTACLALSIGFAILFFGDFLESVFSFWGMVAILLVGATILAIGISNLVSILSKKLTG